MMKKVAIIGAGYTGMIAAKELSKKYKVDIFEQSKNVGGMTATFDAYGTPLECYYRHIFKSDKYVIDLIEELGLSELLIWPKTKMGYYTPSHGMLEFGTPISLLKFKPLNLWQKFRFGLSVINIKLIKNYKKLESISAHEWLLKHAGKKAYENVWEPLLVSKFGVSYKTVSMAWMWGKIVLRGSSGDSDGEELGYVKGSYQVLTDSLEKKLTENKNININKNVSIDSIKKAKDKYILTSKNKKYDGYNYVISSVAYPIFESMCSNLISKNIKNKFAKIEYTAARVMVLFMKKSFMPFYWLNNGDKNIPFGGLIEHTNFIDKKNYKNKNVLYISNYMFEKDELYNLSKDELFAKYVPMLKKINNNFNPKDVERIELFTEKYAQPIIKLNYSDIKPDFKIDNEDIFIASMPQIYPEDRGLNYAIRLGYEVAEELIDNDKE